MVGTIAIETNKPVTAYHIVTGAQVFPYAVDAMHAIGNHPMEWSASPWSREDAEVARKQVNARNESEGVPPLPAPAPLSPEDQKALDEHNKAVAEAADRLKAYYARKAEEEKVAAQVAADEALIASTPPQPDLTVRRPLSPAQIRKAAAQLSPEEEKAKADADKRAADEERARADHAAAQKAASDKAHADQIAASNAKITT